MLLMLTLKRSANSCKDEPAWYASITTCSTPLSLPFAPTTFLLVIADLEHSNPLLRFDVAADRAGGDVAGGRGDPVAVRRSHDLEALVDRAAIHAEQGGYLLGAFAGLIAPPPFQDCIWVEPAHFGHVL